MKRFLISYCALCLVFAAATNFVTAQESRSAIKYEELGDMPTDDLLARIDYFLLKANEYPKSKVCIIGYNDKETPRGNFLKKFYGEKDYMVNRRGVIPSDLIVIDGGYREKYWVEHWIVPNGAELPTPTPTVQSPKFEKNEAYLFDKAFYEEDEFTITLWSFTPEGIEFYANALKANPSARAYIVVYRFTYPKDYDNRQDGRKLAQSAKELLIKKYNIAANRVFVINKRAFRNYAEFWIVPRGARLPVRSSAKRTQA